MGTVAGKRADTMSRLMPLFDTIYGAPRVQSKRSEPMQVLALGPSRTGTESLKAALEHLGYGSVYHGWLPARESPEHAQLWVKLLLRKARVRDGASITPGPCDSITHAELDAILGPYVAVTDVPCMCLGPELIAAYPDAKVILNRRKTYKAWERSMLDGPIGGTNIGVLQALLGLFSGETFWAGLMHALQYRNYFGGDFERNAERGYHEHFERLEKMLPAGSWLDWTVEDGW